MDLGLADRVYLITGGSRGLGFAVAQQLVADGGRVVISSRDAHHVADAVQRLGGAMHASGVASDLADPGTPDRLIDRAVDAFGTVHGALISGGGPTRGAASKVADDDWRVAFETMFLGSVRVARTVAERVEPGGAVGFVLSSSVRSPIDGLGISNGLRPGLAGVAKDMADEFGPHGVRVFGLLPGHILTEPNQERFAAGSPALQAAEQHVPLRRLGDPVEFARVATFLLSPAASYLTGVTVPVDGGAIRSL